MDMLKTVANEVICHHIALTCNRQRWDFRI